MELQQQQSGSSSPPTPPPPPPPFLTKTYDMVDDPETDSVVSWSMVGNSFVVWNQAEFCKELLPKYFKHSNFSSFVRQLNTYGFRKSDPDRWEFAHDEFIRGQRDLLKNIHRRKPMHSHSLHHPQAQGSLSGSLFDSEKQELEEERENLKRETHVLMMELRKNTQQQHKLDEQVQSVNERFQLIGFHHQEMLQRMDQVIRNPDFVSQMLQLTEFYKLFSVANKKRKLPENDDHSYGEEIQIIGQTLVSNEELDVRSVNAMNVEAVYCLESSLNSWEELIYRVGRSSSLETDYVSTPFQLSSVVLTEFPIASENTDTSSYSQSPNPRSSSRLTDIHSSPELAESTTQGESGTFSTVELTHGRHNMDPQLSAGVQHKSSGIDMNSVPASLELQQSAVAKDVTGTAAKARVNDVFWEQFLTETPGRVVDNQEVQSEMRSGDDKRVTSSDSADLSQNKRNVDYLTKQMGQLTPTEKA